MAAQSHFARWVAAGALAVAATNLSAAPLYFNGFESDTSGWTDATRVASGTNGITSADGSHHATAPAATPNVTPGAYTNFGGYNFGAGNAVPTSFQPYRTALDIYLDVSSAAANDTRFDYTSAINNASGTHLRDFVFNIGFYNDKESPCTSTNCFVVSASNNASGWPKNPDRDPFAITTPGWYTFQHTFYDDGGNLAVDLEIFDASDNLLHSWTLGSGGNVPDPISGVGGNRYGWLVNVKPDLAPLAIDNSLLEMTAAAVPEPATLLLIGASLLALAATRRRRH